MFMYVSVSVYMYMYACKHTHTHIYIYTYTHTFLALALDTYIHTYIHYIHTYIHTHTCTTLFSRVGNWARQPEVLQRPRNLSTEAAFSPSEGFCNDDRNNKTTKKPGTARRQLNYRNYFTASDLTYRKTYGQRGNSPGS